MLKLTSACVLCLMLAGCAPQPASTPRPENVERFLKLRGFDFDKNGFFNAVAQKDIAAINAFASGRFDLNVREADGRTALINAAARGHLDVVQALLAVGADVNAKDTSSRTALFHALEARYDGQFRVIFDAIRKLMAPPTPSPKRRIGFISQE